MRERWLVTGASGQLGGHVLRALVGDPANAEVLAWRGTGSVSVPAFGVLSVDLGDVDAVLRAARQAQPTHIVHLGAMTAVADCHARSAEAQRVNAAATATLALVAEELGARFVFASTDMVFAGDAAPYRESDPPAPLSHYGRTKAEAERAIAARPSLVVRIPLMYGLPCTPRKTTFAQQLATLRAGEPLRLFADEFRTPVALADAARALIGLARSDRTGLLHIAGPQRLSRFELLTACARLLGVSDARLIPIARNDVPTAEPRPADLSLDGSALAAAFPNLIPGPLRRDALGE